MNIVLLDTQTLGDDLDLSCLEQFGTLTSYQTTSAKQTLERIVDSDIVITNKVVIDKEIMQQTPQLKLICIAATGMNNVDLDAAKTQNIQVKNVSGYSTHSVTQHTFAMALYLLEKMPYYSHSVASGSWTRSGLFTDISRPFHEINGKKWGIIGLGTIGKSVANIADAFGAEICYYSTSGSNLNASYSHVSLEELLKSCDIISIHAPFNEATHNLINAQNLTLLKDKAILLNLGRGGIINEEALANTLDNKEIYVGLDVLEREPISLTHKLNHIKQKERLLITPHIAWASVEARSKLLQGIVKNIQDFMEA